MSEYSHTMIRRAVDEAERRAGMTVGLPKAHIVISDLKLLLAERDQLRDRVAELEAEVSNGFQSVANRICEHMPEGWVLSVLFEEGAAWVELRQDRQPENSELPDPADKTMLEQVSDALCVANGWRLLEDRAALEGK